MDDLAAVGREVLNEQKAKAMARVGLNDADARSETAAWYDAAELDVPELSKLANTVPGARRFLSRSYILGKNDPAGLPKFFQSLVSERGFRGMVNLACEISRLWPTPKKRPEGASPNGGSALGDSAASAAAGHAPTGDSIA